MVEEKEKLITYISNSVEYLQDKLKEDIKAGNCCQENEKGRFLDNMNGKVAGNKRTWSVFKFGSEIWGLFFI